MEIIQKVCDSETCDTLYFKSKNAAGWYSLQAYAHFACLHLKTRTLVLFLVATQRAACRNSSMQCITGQRIISLFQTSCKCSLHHHWINLKTNLSCSNIYPKIEQMLLCFWSCLLEIWTALQNQKCLKGSSLVCAVLWCSGCGNSVFSLPSTVSLIVRCIGPTFSKTVIILCVFDVIFSVTSEYFWTLKDR